MYILKQKMLYLFCYLFGAEYNKFRLGQILFIFAVTFGLFLSDTIRKILVILALLCLTKSNIRARMYLAWTSKQRMLATIFVVLFAWLLLIPLFFGVDPLVVRIRSSGWLIELLVFIWATLLFAKDSFFLYNIRNCAIFSCSLYSIFAISHRLWLGFNIGTYSWPIIMGSWAVGTISTALLPWIIYDLIVEKLQKKIIFLYLAFMCTSIVIFLTMYTTFWLVLSIEVFMAFVIIYFFSKSHMKRFILFMILTLAVVFCGLSFIAISYHNVYDSFIAQFTQLSFKDFDIERFTNKRYHIWLEAIEFIKMRPILGYGWADFAEFSVEHRIHTHCSFLQAAWTGGWIAMLLLIMCLLCIVHNCLTLMKEKKQLLIVPFVVLVVISAYITTGMLDDMFRASRRSVSLYWVSFTMMLTPLVSHSANDNIDNKGVTK